MFRFMDDLTAHGLHQYVKSTSHKDGHILDLIISHEEDNLVNK